MPPDVGGRHTLLLSARSSHSGRRLIKRWGSNRPGDANVWMKETRDQGTRAVLECRTHSTFIPIKKCIINKYILEPMHT